MSTLWTPDGERPVGRRPEPLSHPPSPRPGAQADPDIDAEPSDEELAARMAELTEQLASTPAAVVVANHAYSLFELAALHLSRQPPQLDDARLAVDAFGALVEGLAGRLGEAEGQLVDALSQLRMAYVQIHTGGAQP